MAYEQQCPGSTVEYTNNSFNDDVAQYRKPEANGATNAANAELLRVRNQAYGAAMPNDQTPLIGQQDSDPKKRLIKKGRTMKEKTEGQNVAPSKPKEEEKEAPASVNEVISKLDGGQHGGFSQILDNDAGKPGVHKHMPPSDAEYPQNLNFNPHLGERGFN